MRGTWGGVAGVRFMVGGAGCRGVVGGDVEVRLPSVMVCRVGMRVEKEEEEVRWRGDHFAHQQGVSCYP